MKRTGPVNYRVDVVRFKVLREGATSTVRPKINGPQDVAAVVKELIPDDAREHFVCLYLGTRNQLIASHEISVGTLSASLVHPREVFGPALRLLGVASVILVHNHPSGDVTPSREDLRLTHQLVQAAGLLDLRVHDHVIVDSGSSFLSLAATGQLEAA